MILSTYYKLVVDNPIEVEAQNHTRLIVQYLGGLGLKTHKTRAFEPFCSKKWLISGCVFHYHLRLRTKRRNY